MSVSAARLVHHTGSVQRRPGSGFKPVKRDIDALIRTPES
jgi:hypothetical protein